MSSNVYHTIIAAGTVLHGYTLGSIVPEFPIEFTLEAITGTSLYPRLFAHLWLVVPKAAFKVVDFWF
jgi:hypothetical protein